MSAGRQCRYSALPYIIAAMIFLSQVKDPARALMELDQGKEERKNF